MDRSSATGHRFVLVVVVLVVVMIVVNSRLGTPVNIFVGLLQCLPDLYYGFEAYPVNKTVTRSLQ